MSRGCEGGRGPSTRPSYCVQIEVMRHLAAWIVVQVEFHVISLTDANEFTRNFTAEGPDRVLHSIRQAAGHLLDLQIDDYLCGIPASDWRWNRRRVGQDRI